jgi:hypothetical protein
MQRLLHLARMKKILTTTMIAVRNNIVMKNRLGLLGSNQNKYKTLNRSIMKFLRSTES